MSQNWTSESLALLRKVKRLKDRLKSGGKAFADEDPEVVRLQKLYQDAESAVDAARARAIDIHNRLLDAKKQASDQGRGNLSHIQNEIESHMQKVKKLEIAVPVRVRKFIHDINLGINHNASHEIVWYDNRFLILRLKGRKFWSARSQAYASAKTEMFDLSKAYKNTRGSFGALDLERKCLVKQAEGRLTAEMLKEWKEYALEYSQHAEV